MKSVVADVQEYDTELPLDIAVLKHRLGHNVDVSASTGTDDPAVMTDSVYEEEKIQESINYVEIQEVVEVGHQTDSSRSTSSTISKQVRKSLPGMDGLEVTLVELGRTTVSIFMRFYSKMVILKNGANTNMK